MFVELHWNDLTIANAGEKKKRIQYSHITTHYEKKREGERENPLSLFEKFCARLWIQLNV